MPKSTEPSERLQRLLHDELTSSVMDFFNDASTTGQCSSIMCAKTTGCFDSAARMIFCFWPSFSVGSCDSCIKDCVVSEGVDVVSQVKSIFFDVTKR